MPLIQFKCVGPKLVETPLTQSDKLNGIDWKGTVSLPLDSSFRYYDYKRKAWSAWSEYHIAYAPSAGCRLLKLFAPSAESSYPQQWILLCITAKQTTSLTQECFPDLLVLKSRLIEFCLILFYLRDDYGSN
jgi:hypothetical protein